MPHTATNVFVMIIFVLKEQSIPVVITHEKYTAQTAHNENVFAIQSLYKFSYGPHIYRPPF